MEKVVYAKTLLTKDVLERLKEKTGKELTKDALLVAVQHYLECEHTEVGDKRV